MLQDNLLDILKHTHDLGFLQAVKVENEGDDTALAAMDTETQLVIMHGKLKNQISEINEHPIGLARMSVLKGYLTFPVFREPDSSLDIVSVQKAAGLIPQEMHFQSSKGHKANYRFMSGKIVEEQLNIPFFVGAKWDIEYRPTEENLNDLQYFSGILASQGGLFSMLIDGDELKLVIDDGTGDSSVIPFATGVTGNVNSSWRYPLSMVIGVLRLGSAEKCMMRVSNEGILEIELESEIGTYSYAFPAKS